MTTKLRDVRSDSFLYLFFTESYKQGIVSEQLKLANVTPIYKGGKGKDPIDYRPVSITPIIAKIFESIILEDVSNHMEYHSHNAFSARLSEVQIHHHESPRVLGLRHRNRRQLKPSVCNLHRPEKSLRLCTSRLAISKGGALRNTG